MWDPGQYLKFSAERSRPFFDLLARVRRENVSTAVDLGCGPGELTRVLAERWPASHVTGVDSSPEMLAQARSHVIPGRLDFVQADMQAWSPPQPVDLLFSNAALQWVPDHERLIPRLASLLAPGGTLAVQVPNHCRTPAHQAIAAAAADPRWKVKLEGVGLRTDTVQPLDWYARRLQSLGFVTDAWETTYLHILAGPDPLVEWMKGTALRPLLARLLEEEQEIFLRQLAERFREAYPPAENLTFFPYPRIFVVAQRS